MFHCCDTVLQDDDPARAMYLQRKASVTTLSEAMYTPARDINTDVVVKTKFYRLPPPQNKN